MGYAEVVVAAMSVLLGWYLGVRSERLSATQYRLSASKFAADWFRDLRSWASEAIDVLSEAAYHAPGRSDDAAIDAGRALACRHRLSALIDRGRFFLPNYEPDAVGGQKPSAFRGHRHPALDYLVAAEHLLAGTAPGIAAAFPSTRAALVAVKRAFVSQIQEILDPRSHNRAIAELVRSSQRGASGPPVGFEKLVQDALPEFADDAEGLKVEELRKAGQQP